VNLRKSHKGDYAGYCRAVYGFYYSKPFKGQMSNLRYSLIEYQLSSTSNSKYFPIKS